MAEQSNAHIRAADYKNLPETNQLQELINGEIVVPPSPMSPHQRLVRRITHFIENHMPHGEVLFAPMDVYLDDDNVFQPDVFWRATNSQCIERDGYFYGAPELVVEVYSPATVTKDKREKFNVYQQTGVQEYWMLDPIGQYMEVWQNVEGAFERIGVFTESNSFISSTLGQELTLKGIFTEPFD